MLGARQIISGAEKFTLLNCRRLPARLSTSEVAVVLGFQEHDIPVLVAAKLLAPLGKPAPNAPKYFAAVDLAERMESTQWLSEATKALANYWRKRNERREGGGRCGVTAANSNFED